MPAPLIETIVAGGCYWKRDRHDSPGHSIALANGTLFKIAIEGSESHRFVGGVCRDGWFVVQDGTHAGRAFQTASEAVNEIREPSSNAFLYVQFHIGNNWVLADDLRRSENSRLDDIEEDALGNAFQAVRNKWKALDPPEALKAAANAVARNPNWIENARQMRTIELDLNP